MKSLFTRSPSLKVLNPKITSAIMMNARVESSFGSHVLKLIDESNGSDIYLDVDEVNRELGRCISPSEFEVLIVDLMSTMITIEDYGERRLMVLFTEMNCPRRDEERYHFSFNYWLQAVMDIKVEQAH